MLRPQLLLPLVFIVTFCRPVQSTAFWNRDNKAAVQEVQESEDGQNDVIVERAKRMTVNFQGKKWNRDLLPFVIDSRFNESEKKIIRDNIQTIVDNTCINFKEDAEDGTGMKLEYSLETEKGQICRSDGAGDSRGNGKNHKLHLYHSCIYNYQILHETMHALGFYHTQQRSDRDNYIVIPEELKNENELYKIAVNENTTDYGVPFEYSSIMFQQGLETIDPDYQNYTGNWGLIPNDWKLINLHYKCHETCSKTLDCKNGGYQHPRKCDYCICTQFHNGTYCEFEKEVVNLTEKEPITLSEKRSLNQTVYYAAYKRFISSSYAGYGNDDFDYNTYVRSQAKIIKAPEGARINVTIVNITDFQPQSYGNILTKAVEVVDGDLSRIGKRFHWTTDIGRSFLSTNNIVGYVVWALPGFDFSTSISFTVVNSHSVATTTVTPPTEHPVTVIELPTTTTTVLPIETPITTTLPPQEEECEF